MQIAEEVKNEKCEEMQQERDVTLHSVKEPQADTNSIDNEVLYRILHSQTYIHF